MSSGAGHPAESDDAPVEFPRLSILIASRNRPAQVQKCLESVMKQDIQAHEILVLDDGSDRPLQEDVDAATIGIDVKWLRNETPSGVSAARNKLVENASGEILVFLDDDAWLIGNDALTRIATELEADNTIGIIAFKIHLNDEDANELQVPFTRKTIRQDPELVNRRQQVSYFVGAGHAIRKSVFEKCGRYPDNFIYGHEELDLSYRAIDHGFTIVYQPSIRVVHEPAASQVAGAGKKRFESYYVTRNRLWLAQRNLPLKYGLVYAFGWSMYYLALSVRHGQLLNWLVAIKDGVTGLDRSQRRPVSPRAIDYIAKHHGRLWR